MPHHVILGGGPAALSAIEAIRGCDDTSPISLISAEPAHDRTLLPRWLAGQISREEIFTADAGYFARLRVDRYIGQPASRLNPRANTVAIKGGLTLAFDDLLIATGSSPVVPAIPGADLPGVQPLWTVAHADALLQAVGDHPNPEVVLVGSGIVAFIILDALRQRGWTLQVVESAAHVLPDLLDADSAAIVADWLKQRGVAFHCNTAVSEIRIADGKKQVALASGVALDADAVILCAGSRPNVALARAAGIATDQGILVNERMQTSFPHVYAAGDAAQGPDFLGGPAAVRALHAVAVEQGRIAGLNMAGEQASYSGSLPVHTFDCCGLHCARIGEWRDDPAETMKHCDPAGSVYRRLVWRGDCIVGAILIGPAGDSATHDDLGMIRELVQARTALGEWRRHLRDNPLDIRRPYLACNVSPTGPAVASEDRRAVTSSRIERETP